MIIPDKKRGQKRHPVLQVMVSGLLLAGLLRRRIGRRLILHDPNLGPALYI
jgi:hypothetical protein